MTITWIISFLKQFWKPLAILLAFLATFYSGWHFRGTKEELKAFKAIEKSAVVANDKSETFEDNKAQIEDFFGNIDTKVTYETNYNCIIPDDGLRILTKATR